LTGHRPASVILPWNWFSSPAGEGVNAHFVNDQAARAILDALSIYFLPLLYGTLGASVYVLRRVAFQLERFTFAPISWFGLTIRLSLGAVFGVTVGLLFGPQFRGSDGSFLSAFAIAFLAGYGVEAVFSVMDRWLYRLREEAPEGETAKTRDDGGASQAAEASRSGS
jgi:hypothetical protein